MYSHVCSGGERRTVRVPQKDSLETDSTEPVSRIVSSIDYDHERECFAVLFSINRSTYTWYGAFVLMCNAVAGSLTHKLTYEIHTYMRNINLFPCVMLLQVRSYILTF